MAGLEPKGQKGVGCMANYFFSTGITLLVFQVASSVERRYKGGERRRPFSSCGEGISGHYMRDG